MANIATPKVFISYSHDSREHSDRVLALAQQLRRDGIDAELDQFHQYELVHWPRWCEEQLRPENSDFVLSVCSAEYRRRIEGRVAADVGKGVFWEGTQIYNYLYDAKGNPRFIPVYFGALDDNAPPSVLQGYTRYCLNALALDDPNSDYAKLYRLLTGQAGIAPADLGHPVRLPPLPAEEQRTDFLGLIAQIDAGVIAIRDEVQDIRARLEDVIAAVRQQPLTAEPLTPQQRYDQALKEVAFKHDLTPPDLRAAIDAWVVKVKADPQASPYDLALAEYKANHFEQAAAQAGIAYDQAMQARQQATHEAIKAAWLEGDAQYAAVHYELALAAYRKAAALTDRVNDPVGWAEGQVWVSLPLYALARYTEAELLMCEILAVHEQHYGPNHPDVARDLNNLALLLKATNRLAEAEPLCRRATLIFARSLGWEHPYTQTASANWVALLPVLGKSKAELEKLRAEAQSYPAAH